MRGTRVASISFVLTIIGAIVVVFAPLGTRCVARGDLPERCEGISAYAMNGSWIFVVTSVPIVIASIPLLIRRRGVRIAAATLLWICCVLGIFSIGLFILPATVVMTIAATMGDDVPGGSRQVTGVGQRT